MNSLSTEQNKVNWDDGNYNIYVVYVARDWITCTHVDISCFKITDHVDQTSASESDTNGSAQGQGHTLVSFLGLHLNQSDFSMSVP